MDAAVIVLTFVVGSFGVASAVLGFIAERTKLTWHDVDVFYNECDYPSNPAYLLAIIAVALLLVAQIIATLAGGCCGCCRPRHGASESKRVVGIIAAVLSWIAALLAGWFYVEGAVWNFPVTRWNDTWCKLLKDGVFRRAALLSLAATALSVASYALLRGQAPAVSTPATAPVYYAAGPSQPKPDVPQVPPAGEAVAIPRHPVGGSGYGQAPYRQLASPPPRQAQPAVEVMMA